MNYKTLLSLFILLLFSFNGFSQSKDTVGGFWYIWNNYQSSPELINNYNPSNFDFGNRYNTWATTAVIRSNFITNNISTARWLFDSHLSQKKDSLIKHDFDTWVEVASVEALLLRREKNLNAADSLYHSIISASIEWMENNDDKVLYGQIALGYFHLAKISERQANRKNVIKYYREAKYWGSKTDKEWILFDILINQAIFETEIQGEYRKGQLLMKQARELDVESEKAKVLYNMASAEVMARYRNNYDDAISLLHESRAMASMANEMELWENIAPMIMRFEILKERHEEKQFLTLIGSIMFILVVVWAALNYRNFIIKIHPVKEEFNDHMTRANYFEKED